MIGNLLAGMLNKGAAQGDYESIATLSVGSGGAASIDWTSIPSTYQHLQIRAILRNNRASSETDFMRMRFNNDSGNNYFGEHILQGNGSTASAGANGVSTNNATIYPITASTAGSNRFAFLILDILDYASVNKNKTVRYLSGYDNNGSGEIRLGSSLWMNSSTAINRITITPAFGDLVQYSHAALYGIKG